jgi:hypothetical protein
MHNAHFLISSFIHSFVIRHSGFVIVVPFLREIFQALLINGRLDKLAPA